MAEHNEIGLKGEQIAVDFLLEKGYTLLETNWKFRNLEADIIALINNVIVVVEVKTRRSNYFGEPELFVNKQKQRNLIQVANEYILKHRIDSEVRFDIISIVISGNNNSINHIEDAFNQSR